MKLKLNHVALTVSNRENSAEFYGKWFGLNQRLVDDDHLLILADDAGNLLALSHGEVPLDLPRTNHFGFLAENTNQVVEMREQIRQAGIEEAEWQKQGPTRLQMFDPDGYRVEIYAF